MLSVNSLDDAFATALSSAGAFGGVVSPRGMASRELLSVTFLFNEPRARYLYNEKRDWRSGYAAASVAWNLAQRNDVESICWWNPSGRRISDDGESFLGANYGQRMMVYLRESMHLLQRDRETRRAWVPIWTPEDLVNIDGGFDHEPAFYSRDGKDVPCTVGFSLRVIEELLVMQVVMRSQNLYGVFPYDAFLFSVLQELIANELGIEPGPMYWHMLSAHLYERDWDAATDAVRWWREAQEVGAQPGVMEPIKLTLTEATAAYPLAMNDIMAGRELSSEQLDDPIIGLMSVGAPRDSAR